MKLNDDVNDVKYCIKKVSLVSKLQGLNSSSVKFEICLTNTIKKEKIWKYRKYAKL